MLTLLDELGTEKLKSGLESFGFGKSTNSLYGNEATGELVFNNKVSASTTVFGQGSTVTAMQMVQAETAILNDGQMLAPYFLQRVHDKTLDKDVNIGKKTVVGNPISKQTADIMKEELYGVVNGPWAQNGRKYALENYSTSGKTGTAEVVDPKTGTYYKSPFKVMHSFIGYAPSEDPQVILYVGMKLPTKDVTSGSAYGATEIFKPIMENTLNYLNVKKSNDNDTVKSYQMENVVGENVDTTILKLQQKTKNIITIGAGNNIIGQYPSADNVINQDERVFLLVSNENILMPNFIGWSKVDVLNYAKLSGLDIEIEGNGFVKQQSIPPQRFVKKGDKIKIKFS